MQILNVLKLLLPALIPSWNFFDISMSWAAMIPELLFPFSLLTSTGLTVALILTAGFMLSNAIVFGLNRFFRIWIAVHPSLPWLQQRTFSNLSI